MRLKKQSYEMRRKKNNLRRRLKSAKEREQRAILLKSMIQTKRDFTTEFKIIEFKNLLNMFPDDFLPLQEDIKKLKKHSAYDPKDILKSIEQKQNETTVVNNIEPSEAREIDTELSLKVQKKETGGSAGQVSIPVKMEIEVFDYAIPTTSSCGVKIFESKNSNALNYSNEFLKSAQAKKNFTEDPNPTPDVVDCQHIKTEVELEDYKIDSTPLESKSDTVIIVQSAQPGIYMTEESNLNSPIEIKTEIEESDYILR